MEKNIKDKIDEAASGHPAGKLRRRYNYADKCEPYYRISDFLHKPVAMHINTNESIYWYEFLFGNYVKAKQRRGLGHSRMWLLRK